jgi:predicted ester cyclase
VSENDNVQLYRRFIEDGVGVGNLEMIDELLAPGIAIPTVEPPNAEGLRALNASFRAGFPDLKASIDEVFANGDWVAARLTWSGTNTAELSGQPATNRFVQATEIEIVRIEDGRIVELRQVADLGSLMSQLAG